MNSTEQQLLSDMKENFQNFKCTLQDLRNPTENFVNDFCSYWLQEFEVDINNISQTQFAQTVVVGSYQDAFSGIIPKGNLLNSIRAFDVVPDFGILDIISPTPKRTQAILRAFITFYSWADHRATSIMEKKKILNERKQKLSILTKEISNTKENLNSVIINIGRIQESKSQLEREVCILQQKSSELVQEKQVLKEKTDKLNEEIKEKENALQKLNREDFVISSKMKECSGLVVDSPSSILTELESLRRKNEEMNEFSEQKRDMVESKMQSHNKLQNVIDDQQYRITLLNELLKLIDQRREFVQNVSSTEMDTNNSHEHLKELKSLLIAQSNKKQSRQEELQSVYLKWKTLKPQLSEGVKAALSDLKEKKNEKNKIMNSLKEDSLVQEDIDLISRKIEAHINNFLNDYKNLQLQEDLYLEEIHSNLESDMENTLKDIDKDNKNIDFGS